ncbi:hypothetical protein [Methylocapsa palsarum]|uniref:Glycine zipper 2TM domain-containing protein n=1 Tax=Methylocapsa palsarum TaxID=1612308 RepID=A0A1I3XFA5_9HYPH|nr:hypothetical protein [Methylocapsa palsarum]SFK18193.1 hypothetical protein SAMN05444581_10385 [Methylocapsa palsarum]
MNKFIFTAAIAGLAFAITASPTKAGCVKDAIVGGIVGHMMGHGAVGAATGCAYGVHQSHKAKQQREENSRRDSPDQTSPGRTY